MTQREKLIEQSMKMFITHGIKSVRMDDIAQEAGISKRTLYEIFVDKENLIYQSLLYFFEEYHQRWEQIASKAQNSMEALFIVFADILEHSEPANRIFGELRKYYPDVYERIIEEGNEHNHAKLSQMLTKGITDGIFIDTINIDLAISILSYTGMMLRSHKELILPEGGVNERQACVQIVSTFFRGISTAQGLQLIDDCLVRHRKELYG